MAIDERDGRAFPKRWTGLAATGTNRATAFLLLDGGYHEFTTVGSGSGVALPVVMPWSREITISNNGANALLIYPPSGGTIDTVSSSVSLAAGSSATYWATSPTNWQDRVTGGSGGGGGGSTTITEVSQTSSFTATANSFYAISGSSNVTATLPTAVGIAGQTIRIRCVSGYTGLCTITGTSSQTIGPASATSQILYAGESALLQSDGANWVRTGGTIIPARAQITLAASQTIPDNSSTKVLMDTPGFDNTGHMNLVGSNAIKPFRPGQYRITSYVQTGVITTAESDVYTATTSIAVNGTNGAGNGQIQMSGPGIPFTFSNGFTVSLTLAAGDLVTVSFYCHHTGTQTVSVGGNVGTFLEVEEIPSW
jgi:hypothetical protein